MDVDVTLFSARSLQTMFHGILLSGGAVAAGSLRLARYSLMSRASDETRWAFSAQAASSRSMKP